MRRAGPAIALLLITACAGADRSIPPSATGMHPSATPSVSEPPSPSAGELGADSPKAGDWIEVVVDGLEVRATPGARGDVLWRVSSGAEGLVIGEPDHLDGAAWVPVAAPELPNAGGCAEGSDDLSCPVWSGWLAVGPVAQPFVVRAELDCPAAPKTVSELKAVPIGESVACFGGKTLTIRAFLSPEMRGRGCPAENDATPTWIYPCAAMAFHAAETEFGAQPPEFWGSLHGSLETCELWGSDDCPVAPLIGQWVEVRGMFDHPEADQCHSRVVDPDARPMDPMFAIYECRKQFVITAMEPAAP